MKTIVCYGDSNTWGHRSYRVKQTDPALMRFPWGVRWTSLLQNKLGPDYRVEECGLNGRTTMFDDPLAEDRNGLASINVTLQMHYPLDMVIIMLGTNDVKEFFGMPPYVIARGAGRIIEKIQQGTYGPDGGVPEILLVAPLKLHPATMESWLADEFGPSSLDKDAQLGMHYEKIAKDMGVHFMNAAEFVEADSGDGVHMNEAGHATMAEKMYAQVKKILG
ncbi:MAG: arylesterase [Clostridia bacterium]|nr:arylesterase [Clostridia bacterium]